MKINVLTLFPQIVESYFRSSIMGRAVEKGIVEYRVVDIRDYARDKHRTCDDAPYGGGAGMVLKPEPLGRALEAAGAGETRTIYVTPAGKPYSQEYAGELSREPAITILCGRYEGVDQRIIDLYVDDEISIGEYVLSSGELAGCVVIDAAFRLIEGVISGESLEEESFRDGLLEYPHYTRPVEWGGLKVPEVLLSGHHKRIEEWRLEKRFEKTRKNRPRLLEEKYSQEDARAKRDRRDDREKENKDKE